MPIPAKLLQAVEILRARPVPVSAPNGQIYLVPLEKCSEALRAGGQLAINVAAPNRSSRWFWIPIDQDGSTAMDAFLHQLRNACIGRSKELVLLDERAIALVETHVEGGPSRELIVKWNDIAELRRLVSKQANELKNWISKTVTGPPDSPAEKAATADDYFVEKLLRILATLRSTQFDLSRELTFCLRDLPDAAQHPWRYRLAVAYTSRLQKQLESDSRAIAVMQGLEPGWYDELVSIQEKQRVRLQELEELKTLRLYKARSGAQDFLADKTDAARILRDIGYHEHEIPTMLRRAQELARGAPVTRRWQFVEALEMIAKGLGLNDVLAELCDCGREVHSRKCADRFRKGIENLKQLLAKYDDLKDIARRFDHRGSEMQV